MASFEWYFSIVIPAFNEEGSVAKLHAEIIKVLNKTGQPFEVIFINDGSNDNTLEILKELSPIKIINFRRNFGQTSALDAGIKASRGKYIVTMDADGQNDPADIPKLFEKLESENLDMVAGWRKIRQDKFLKRLSSRLASLLRKILINDGIHDSGCTLKIYRRECFDKLDLFGEMHRFIPGLLRIKGFKVGELEVNHRARLSGQTKYNWKRGVKGVLDMISVWFWKKYANRPFHLFGGFGLILIAVSIIAGVLALYQKIYFDQDLSETALTILSMFGFLTGVQFFVFGLLADIISKNYYATTKDRVYDIKEVISNEENPNFKL